MVKAKKMLIRRSRREFYVLRRKLSIELFCEACGASGEFLSLADAVAVSGVSMREIVRMAETGEIHFLESLGGHLFVCRASLGTEAKKRLSNRLITN